MDKKIELIHCISNHAPPFIAPPNTDRFLMVFTTGESEMFEYNSETEVLVHLENERQKEHDKTVTGCDSNKFMNLLVTSDYGGMVRIWNLDKRFLREIQFPHPVDGVCFLNMKGDILVSHVERISHVKFETYWTSTFTQFGVTKLTDGIHIKYKAKDSSIETELYDDFIVDKAPPKRTRINDEEHLHQVLRDTGEDSEAEKPLTKGDASASASKSYLMESTQRSAMKQLKKDPLQASGKKLSVMTATGEAVDGKSNISRLADSALKNFKLQQPSTTKN